MKSFLILFLCQFITVFTSFGQNTVLHGNILDAETGAPVPFVSVGQKNLHKGTSSNSIGQFQLRVDSLPVTLVFNHLSFNQSEQVVSNEEPLTIKLVPSEVIMKEVVVKSRKRESYLYGLIRKAFARVLQLESKNFFGKAYYRQLSKNGDNYTGLYEIFFDAIYSRRGIKNWAIQEGRYALRSNSEDQTCIYNKNFTLLCRVLTTIQPNSKDIIHPVSKEAELYYDFKIINLLNAGDRKIAVISFEPKRNVTSPTMNGELYIDIDNYDLLKIRGRINNDRLKFVKLNMKGGGWKEYILSFEMAFKESSGDALIMDYISLDQSFDYYLDDAFMHTVSTHALLSFYENYVPETRRRLGGKLSMYWDRDRDVLDKIGYNKDFWEENPIVKRTPVEKEVIDSFEVSNAFGSVYLNNREQIVLEGNELNTDPIMTVLSDSLRRSRYASTGEKIYLHKDKTFYLSGETLWFSAYLVNAASHIFSQSSRLVYVELLDTAKTVLVQKRVYMDQGRGYGQIDLPDSLTEGLYQLRAYTNWMRNFGSEWFFHQQFYVVNLQDSLKGEKSLPNANGDIDLQFFPEGGELTAGIPVRVSFKAIGPEGGHVHISGKIFDSSGKEIMKFISIHAGMGSFILRAKKGVSYHAVVKGSKARYKLPEVRPSGINMMVDATKPEGINLLIRATQEYGDMDYYLVAQMRGVIFHRYKGRLQNMTAQVEMPKSKFPDGVLQITLFDKNGLPLCERLTFIDNRQTPYVKFNVDDNKLTPRKQIGVAMQLKDADGRTIRKAGLSVSITDAGLSAAPEYFEDIGTWLLLNSDLRGNIEDPGYYFERDDKEHLKNLDLVMLTHGWRRFTWKAVLASASREYSFAHEKGINISGQVYRKGTHKLMGNTLLRFIPVNSIYEGFMETLTDVKGNFGLHNVFVTDTTWYIVQGLSEKERQVKVEVLPDNLKTPEVIFDKLNKEAHLKQLSITYVLKDDEYRKFVQDLLKDKNTILLDDITFRLRKGRFDGRIYPTPDEVIKVDEDSWHYSDVLDLLQGRVAGLKIERAGSSANIMMRGMKSINDLNTTPLILIDGVPMNSSPQASVEEKEHLLEKDSGISLNADLGIDALVSLPITDVERIEVLKGNAASIFGSRGSKGVIAVYTRRGQGLEPVSGEPKYQRLRLRGFSVEREFYIPDYREKSASHKIQDYRTTLYWNPDIPIAKNGWVRFDFFNNDHAKRLQVVIQGITKDGVPVSAVTWIGE